MLYLNRGVYSTNYGKYELAVKDYDQAIKLNPSLLVAYYNRGVAFIFLNFLEKAASDF